MGFKTNRIRRETAKGLSSSTTKISAGEAGSAHKCLLCLNQGHQNRKLTSYFQVENYHLSTYVIDETLAEVALDTIIFTHPANQYAVEYVDTTNTQTLHCGSAQNEYRLIGLVQKD